MDTIKQDFVKWVYKSDTSKGLNDITITDNSTVFVPVVQNKHKVEFKLNGSLINTSTIYVSDGQYASYPGATPVSSDTTKVFDKWVVEGKSDDISSTPITSDTVFEATFMEIPSITPDPNALTTVIDYDKSNTCKFMFINAYASTTSVYVEGKSDPIFTVTHNQVWVDISAYVGTDTRFIIKSSFCYSDPNAQRNTNYKIEFCESNGSWTWVKTGLEKVLDASCLGQIIYVTV